MPREIAQCDHCGGKKTCTAAGGKSCDDCLFASGRRHREWATVRCSYCGGRGTVVVDTDEQPETDEEVQAEQGDAAGDE